MVSATGLARAANVVSTWNTTSTGNWSDPTKWSNAPAAATFPNNGNLGHAYDAVIPRGTALLDRDVAVRDFTLAGGNLRYANTAAAHLLTVSRTLNLGGGMAPVNARVQPGGALVLASSTSSAWLGTLNVAGTVSFGFTNGSRTLISGLDSVLEIEPTGSFALTRPLFLRLNPDPFTPGNLRGRLINRGTIDQSAGADLSSDWRLVNYGTFRANASLDLQSYESAGGLLDLQGSAAAAIESANIASGHVRIAPGASLSFTNRFVPYAHEFGAFAVTNAGTFNLNGPAHFAQAVSLPGAVKIEAGIGFKYGLQLDADVTLAGPATLRGFSIGGAGRLRVMNLNFTDGDIAGGELNVPAGGTVTLPGPYDLTLSKGGRFTVDGTVVWRGRWLSASGTTVSRVEVRPGGVITGGQGGVFGGTGNASLVNAGLIDVDRGRLFVNDAWSVVNSGTIRAAGGSIQSTARVFDVVGLLDLRASAAATFSGGQSLTVAPGGRVFLATSARATVGIAATNAGTIELDGPTVQFSAQRPFVNSGAIRGAAGSTLTFSAYPTYAYVTNSGTIDLDSRATAVFSAGLYQSTSNALLRVAGSASATVSQNGSIPLVNAGSIRVEGGGRLTVGFSTSNTGSVRVGPGGTSTFAGFSNSGAVHLAGPGAVASFGAFTNAGTVHLAGPDVTASFSNVANLAGAVFRVASSSIADLPGPSHTFSNRGSVEVDTGSRLRVQGFFNNSGTVRVAAAVLTVNAAFRFTNTGTIDLSAGGGLVALTSASALSQMRSQILSGYAGGAWTGTGITSLDARVDPTTAVGYATASNVAAAPLAWLGTTSNSGNVILRHTKYGDADLDGLVDFADLVRLAQNYNGTNRTWSDGDFTYDGAIDFNDLVKLAQNYNTALQPAAIPGAPASFNQDLARAFASVPEPSALPLLAPAACGLAARRRRQHHTRPRA